MSERLEMLRRVAVLRERRAERERIAARAEAAAREHEFQRAADSYAREVRCRQAADGRFADHAADPQAQAWRTITHRRTEALQEAASIAEGRLTDARRAAEAARGRHEQACTREEQLGLMVAKARRAQRQRCEAIADEASQETRQ